MALSEASLRRTKLGLSPRNFTVFACMPILVISALLLICSGPRSYSSAWKNGSRYRTESFHTRAVFPSSRNSGVSLLSLPFLESFLAPENGKQSRFPYFVLCWAQLSFISRGKQLIGSAVSDEPGFRRKCVCVCVCVCV